MKKLVIMNANGFDWMTTGLIHGTTKCLSDDLFSRTRSEMLLTQHDALSNMCSDLFEVT